MTNPRSSWSRHFTPCLKGVQNTGTALVSPEPGERQRFARISPDPSGPLCQTDRAPMLVGATSGHIVRFERPGAAALDQVIEVRTLEGQFGIDMGAAIPLLMENARPGGSGI